MKTLKKTLPLLLLAALLLSAGAVREGTGPAAASAYFLDGALHAFARLPDYDPPAEPEDAMAVGLMVNGVQVGEAQAPEKPEVQRLLLLLDCSGSMPVYRDQIAALCDSLTAGKTDYSITLAGFGDQYRILAEDLTDGESLRRALNAVGYHDQGTDISGGVVYAIRDVKERLWVPGELTGILLITDGEPFYTYNAEKEAESERTAAEVLRKTLEDAPEITLHTVSFADWEPVTHDALVSGGGLDLAPRSVPEAKDTGEALAAYYESLYALHFPLAEYSEMLGLRIDGRDILTIRRSADLTAQEEVPLEALPAIIDKEDDPPAPESPEPTATPEPTPEPTPVPAAPPPVARAAAETPAPTPETPVETEAPEPKAGALPGGLSPLTLGLIIGGAVLLAAVIVLAVLLLRRRGNVGQQPPMAPSAPTQTVAPGALPMQMEVLYGATAENQGTYFLSESLFLGSDGRCEIVIPESAVSPVNTRIFRKDGGVYIEDLNSNTGTCVGGMRIYAPNPLRSGDEVMVGQTVVRFIF